MPFQLSTCNSESTHGAMYIRLNPYYLFCIYLLALLLMDSETSVFLAFILCTLYIVQATYNVGKNNDSKYKQFSNHHVISNIRYFLAIYIRLMHLFKKMVLQLIYSRTIIIVLEGSVINH